MLVLSRKEGEKIRIGDNILLTVVRVSPKAIRIGIEAPSSIPIVRAELAEGVPAAPVILRDPASQPQSLLFT
ncbi:MAG TPA: carbon storage regulator [Planctomycetaceae bacterium]|nr:carbon storage regulator [Planctomycetaceae bacterium]